MWYFMSRLAAVSCKLNLEETSLTFALHLLHTFLPAIDYNCMGCVRNGTIRAFVS